jgi:RimJ/RimL family protein N-acetyltransferase
VPESEFGPQFIDLVLDLDAFDPDRAAAAERDLAARGIALETLATEQRRRAATWLAEFTDLENATRAHLGEPPRTPAEMVERLAFLRVAPEALFVARAGERYLGYTCLNVRESDGETLVQGWTGVRPEARGRGLATALKLVGAAYAKARGYRRLVTAPRRTNAASLRTNAKVGFRARSAAEGRARRGPAA